MKKVEATFRPEKLEVVKKALSELGISGMTVTEVLGRGRQDGITLQWRASEYKIDLLPKVKIEVVVLDEDLEKVLSAVTLKARTGERGDGKIFVLPVDEAMRIRTGEVGERSV